jgi:hypothetical protein
VVINVTGNDNVHLKNTISLDGGITDNHVFINILGSGKQIGGNTNKGVIHGVIVGIDDKFNVNNTTISGKIIGGGNQDFQLDSNFKLLSNVSAVPEASTWMMMIVGFGGLGYTMRSRRRAGARWSVSPSG